jgi:uncharacterized protein (DUF885 family)
VVRVSTDLPTLASTFVDETVAADPVIATHLGVPGFDHLWPDYSTEGSERFRDLVASQASRLAQVPRRDDPWDALASAVIGTALEDLLDRFAHDDHLLDLNSITSPLQDIREVFDHMDLSTEEAWGNAVERLHGLPEAMGAYLSRLEDGRRRGLTVAKRQVLEAIRQARVHAGPSSAFCSLAQHLAASGIGGDRIAERLDDGVEAAQRGFAEAATYLEGTYLPDAGERDGVGRDRYLRDARRFLGSDLDTEATYAWGWEEVARLSGRMRQVAAQISPGTALPGVLDLLQTDPDRSAPSQEVFRQLMLERLDRALGDLHGAHFEVPAPIRRLDVKMAPPGGHLGAYYVPPSEDYTRPGTVWWSLGEKQRIPLFDQVSTAYHEGFPGHHLQAGIQQASADNITRYQKLLVWYPGTGEGWALYAEDVMEELGYLDTPDYLMGKLASEMLRACRVVIDIGSHLELALPAGQPFHAGEPWTFDAGVEMLMDYAAQDQDTAVSEMNRYLGWPGQAIAYKVGQQAIRDLRAEQAAVAGFDLKRFHARVLEIGSTGLDVLRAHVRIG